MFGLYLKNWEGIFKFSAVNMSSFKLYNNLKINLEYIILYNYIMVIMSKYTYS